MASFKDLLNQRVKNLESNPLTFVNGIESELLRKLKEMTDLLSSLSINSQGQIINSAENLVKINEITSGIGDIYYDDQYIETLRSFAGDFDSQLNLNKELLRELGDFSDDALFAQTMRAGQSTAVNALSKTAVTTHLSEPIREMLTTSVTTNAKFSDAVEFIKTQIGLNPDIESRWTRHAKQIAFDSFAISDRQTATLMAKQNGYDHYLYYGTKKDTTRCFCLDRLLKVYPEEKYKEWGRREDLGECDLGGRWAGMNDATNEDNILVFMGGWNCRHVPMAVQAGFNTKTVGGDGGQVDTFTPAKTIKDAEKFATRFAERVDYSDFTVEQANEINRTLVGVHTGGKIRTIKAVPKEERFLRNGRLNVDDLEINPNVGVSGPKSDKSFQRYLKRRERYLEQGIDNLNELELEQYNVNEKRISNWTRDFAYNEENIESIVTHEYGHKIDLFDRYDSLQKERDLNKLFRTNLKNPQEWTKKVLGDYATKNFDELFAEAYVAYIQRPGDLPDWLKEYIENRIANAR